MLVRWDLALKAQQIKVRNGLFPGIRMEAGPSFFESVDRVRDH